MKYTDFIGQKVVSCFEAKLDSYVVDIILKNNKIFKFVLADFETEETKILTIKDVFCVGKNAILIKNLQKIAISNTNLTQNLIKKEVFDIFGNSFVEITDIEFLEDFSINKITTKTNSFKPKQIINIGQVVLINSSDTNFSNKNFYPRKKLLIKKTFEQKVSILNSVFPTKIVSNNFLIGKKLFKNLNTKNGLILARKNDVITPATIQNAKKHNVFNELLNSVI